jgi:hypothetical protein
MNFWEREADIRYSLTKGTIEQMSESSTRMGPFAHAAFDLVKGFFQRYNQFPVNYKNMWAFFEHEGYDLQTNIPDGSVTDAAYDFIQQIDAEANKLGLDRIP